MHVGASFTSNYTFFSAVTYTSPNITLMLWRYAVRPRRSLTGVSRRRSQRSARRCSTALGRGHARVAESEGGWCALRTRRRSRRIVI